MSERKRHSLLRALFWVTAIVGICFALGMIPLRQYHAEQTHLSLLQNEYPSLGATTLVMGPDWLRAFVFYTTGSLNMLERVVAIDVSGDTNRNGNFPPTKIDFDDQDLAQLQVAFPHLQELCLTRTKVSDSSIPLLMEFHEMKSLYLHESRVSHAGLSQLRKSGLLLVHSNQ